MNARVYVYLCISEYVCLPGESIFAISEERKTFLNEHP